MTLKDSSSAGATAASDFSIAIVPAPLTITGGSPTNGTSGTPINITFGATEVWRPTA